MRVDECVEKLKRSEKKLRLLLLLMASKVVLSQYFIDYYWWVHFDFCSHLAEKKESVGKIGMNADLWKIGLLILKMIL